MRGLGKDIAALYDRNVWLQKHKVADSQLLQRAFVVELTAPLGEGGQGEDLVWTFACPVKMLDVGMVVSNDGHEADQGKCKSACQIEMKGR